MRGPTRKLETGFGVLGAGFGGLGVSSSADGGAVSEPNLFTFPTEFDNAAWSKFRASISANAIADPDGGMAADKLNDSTDAFGHGCQQSLGTISTSTAYVMSCKCKAGEKLGVRLVFGSNFPANSLVHYNISTGALVSAGPGLASHGITDLGDGWYQVYMSSVSTGTSSTNNQIVIFDTVAVSHNYTGTGSDGIYIYDAKFQLGATPS